jgi:hypothetical protein
MSLQIIIRGKNRYGKSRAEQEANLRRDGYVGMKDEHFEKAKWLEKRTGYKGFIPQNVIGNTDMADGSSSKEK